MIRLERYSKKQNEVDLLWEMYCNPEYKQFFRRFGPGYTKEQLINIEEGSKIQLYSCFTNDIVGLCILDQFDPFASSVQAGLSLKKEYQDVLLGDKKIAFWCIVSLAKMLFDDSTLRKISFRFLKIRSDIEHSFKAGGLRKEGDFKESAFFAGEYVDEVEYAFLKSHYNKNYKGKF